MNVTHLVQSCRNKLDPNSPSDHLGNSLFYTEVWPACKVVSALWLGQLLSCHDMTDVQKLPWIAFYQNRTMAPNKMHNHLNECGGVSMSIHLLLTLCHCFRTGETWHKKAKVTFQQYICEVPKWKLTAHIHLLCCQKVVCFVSFFMSVPLVSCVLHLCTVTWLLGGFSWYK